MSTNGKSINKSRDMEVIKVTVTRNRVKNDSLKKERDQGYLLLVKNSLIF